MKRINYSFYVLALSALAVSSIVITLLNKISPLFTSKALFLCQKVFSSPNTLILIIGFILGIGLLSFSLQLGKTHALLRKLLINRVDIPKDLNGIIASLGLSDKVILIKDGNLFSFCCGIFSPYIVITTGLVRSLTDKEIEAVLLHEQSHLISRDAIKVLIGKTFSSMFFFLPIFRELNKNIEAVNELLADQWTITHQQKRTFLRKALKKILAAPQVIIAAVPNVSGPDYFEIRIHRLVNPGIKYRLRLSSVSLATTFLFIFMSWSFLLTPVNAFRMDSESNSADALCSTEKSLSQQCHHSSEESTSYTSMHLCLSE